MRTLVLIVAAVAVLYGLSFVVFPTYTHHFRLTIEVETPEGLKSGSSVMQSSRIDHVAIPLPGQRYEFDFRGEAVFVDLGGGKHVIAVLGFGPRADNVDHVRVLALKAWGLQDTSQGWAAAGARRGQTEITGDLIPTFVTLADLNDPRTARIVHPDEFEKVFGSGTRFRGAKLEITSSPVTREIEGRLSWLPSFKGYLGGQLHPDWSKPERNLTGNQFIRGKF